MVYAYIKNCAAKRKAILDAGLDTASETFLPTVEEIEKDVDIFGFDKNGDYISSWGITDSCDYDEPILLNRNEDFTEAV